MDVVISQNRAFRSATISDRYSDYLVCKSEPDNSVAKPSSKFRRNVRRLWKKLREKGELTTHLYQEHDQLGEAFN